MDILTKVYRFLNPELTLFDRLEQRLTKDTQTIADLKETLDQCQIELADKAFYVEEFATVSQERDALIEALQTYKQGRDRDMETVKAYMEDAGQFRNTIAGLRKEITALREELTQRRDEQAPMGEEIFRLHNEARRKVPPVTEAEIAGLLQVRTGIPCDTIDPDSPIGSDAAAIFDLLQCRGYPGPAPAEYPTWQQVKAKWDELTDREGTNDFEDEADFLNFLEANLPHSNTNETEKESAA